MSADFSKISGSLSSMFTNDNEKPPSNNVLLITCEYDPLKAGRGKILTQNSSKESPKSAEG